MTTQSGHVSGMARQPERSTTGRRARYLTLAWVLLLAVGALFVLAALADLAADVRTGIPADHAAAFRSIAGIDWDAAKQSSPGMSRYVTLLEYAYAVHELVFGILFVAIVAIPLRRGERWAWWACWAVMLSALAYALTFGRHDATTLVRSLVVVVALPVLLLLQVPVLFGSRARTSDDA